MASETQEALRQGDAPARGPQGHVVGLAAGADARLGDPVGVACSHADNQQEAADEQLPARHVKLDRRLNALVRVSDQGNHRQPGRRTVGQIVLPEGKRQSQHPQHRQDRKQQSGRLLAEEDQ